MSKEEKRQQLLSLAEQWQKCGQSQQAFAQEHHINVFSFNTGSTKCVSIKRVSLRQTTSCLPKGGYSVSNSAILKDQVILSKFQKILPIYPAFF